MFNLKGVHSITMTITLLSLAIQLASPHDVSSSDKGRFALLVGVDDYAQPSDSSRRVTPLNGPGNDIGLMKSVLVDQFWFQDDLQHVMLLRGNQATHANIREAFRTHLIENAKNRRDNGEADAIVVFYFSGHGSQTFHVLPDDDTVHDTLVAYDSRSDTGKDIIDTEIVDWFEELRKYTSNISFVLDSCHSGNAIRGLESLTSRNLPPNGKQEVRTARHASSLAVNPHILLTRRQQFALLSGSHADELSYEGEVVAPFGKTVHGYFTYYLFQALRDRPNTTVEQAMRDTALALAQTLPYQHPQATGNIEGRIFGHAEDREDPYVTVVSDPVGDTFEIGAGSIHGIREGAFLAIYAPTAVHLSGEKDKIADARVTKAGDFTSTAILSGAARFPVTRHSKVGIVTPFFGFERLRVHLDDLPGQTTMAADKELLGKVEAALSNNQLIQVTKSQEPYHLAIRRGCNAGNSFFLSADARFAPASCIPAYYLTPSTGDYRLFGSHVLENDLSAVAALSDKIERRAKQENIRGMDNALSPLRGKLAVSLDKVLVTVDQATGKATVQPDFGPETGSPGVLRIGRSFRLKVQNRSDHDLYVAAIMIGSSGAIELISTNPRGDLIRMGASMISYAPRRIGPPPGLETYKVIATTSPSVDFRILEQVGGAKQAGTSALQWLVGQATNTIVRDSGPIKDINLDDWTTASVDVIVRE